MAPQAASRTTALPLLRILDSVIVHQALYAAATLGLADLLKEGACTTVDLARQLDVNEPALYRTLRALASEGIFQETAPRTFANTDLSHFLRTGVPGSIRSILIFRGSGHFYAPFGEILYSVKTGESARTRMLGMDGFEYLRRHPETARIFDDAMTNLSELSASAIASAYDFGRWGSLMDVGGGNGILLATILKTHWALRGVLADLPHVIERARERGYFSGELADRSAMQDCDFFHDVPSGCQAYVLKNVINDWDDERAHVILVNCRKVIPAGGVLLLVGFALPEGNVRSAGKLVDIAMLVLTGGKHRTVQEHRDLLAGAGFRQSQVIPVPGDLNIIEKSRSRSLYPAVTLALSTTMRYSEIRLLKWKQIDFFGKRVWVGRSKTEYGEGRPIPMKDRAFQVMTMWAETFPNRKPEHYVFPTEKYGAAGNRFTPCAYATHPAKPIGDRKEAWEAARKCAGLSCRFHDLRDTACTRMLESGVPLSVVATIMGWSPSTTVRMSRRYGHIGQAAQVEAVRALNGQAPMKIPEGLPAREETKPVHPM